MKKFWKWFAGWTWWEKTLAALGAVGLLAVERYLNEISVKELVDEFLTGAKAWLMQPVSFALVWLIIGSVALVWSFGYIALIAYRKSNEVEASDAELTERRHDLSVIANATNAGVPLTIRKIFDFAGMDQLNFDHALYELQTAGLIRTYNNFQKGTMLMLTPEGNKYVLDHELAHKRIVAEFGGQRPR